jgi:membrane dipeptidase
MDIQRIAKRGGVIGTALDNWMLDAECGQGPGKVRRVATLVDVVNHIDHVSQVAGSSKHSAIGTDLDGGFGTEQTPVEVDTIADLQKLTAILSHRGYSENDIEGILYRNWYQLMERAWSLSARMC